MQNRKKPKAEKMPEKVFLTVGRHGRYSYGARLPLSESSILEGVYRGQELTAAYGSFDAVYSSDIPRAKATANLRAVGGDYARDKIVYSPELTEDSSLGSVSLFLDILAAEASLNGFRHVHLVTHAPVIEKIFPFESGDVFCAARRRFYRGNRKLGRFARTEGEFYSLAGLLSRIFFIAGFMERKFRP